MSKRKLKKLNKIKMKSFRFNHIRPVFTKWLDKNMDNFNIRPIYAGDDKYRFEGLIKHLYLQMDFLNLESMIACNDENDKNYDFISIEYIGCLKYNPTKGYYDADRTDGIFDYFKTLNELYVANVCEPIIEYVNKNLVYNNCLVLSSYHLGDDCLGTDGKIQNKNEYIKKDSIDYVYDLYL